MSKSVSIYAISVTILLALFIIFTIDQCRQGRVKRDLTGVREVEQGIDDVEKSLDDVEKSVGEAQAGLLDAIDETAEIRAELNSIRDDAIKYGEYFEYYERELASISGTIYDTQSRLDGVAKRLRGIIEGGEEEIDP